MRQKSALAINDISCVGRCSLTVSLPLISASGVECSILPTAILSTHTGGFSNFTFTNCENDILPITAHWKSLGIEFDTIYTGFLGSTSQIDLVIDVINKFKREDNLVVVDPVMADNGELYAIFDANFAKEMKRLCLKADIIIPNITEACLLTGIAYKKDGHDLDYLNSIFHSFSAMGISQVVLTGVSLRANQVGVATFDGKTIKCYERPLIEGYYHGTGDVFGSVFVAAITKGHSLFDSAVLAVEITVESIEATKKYDREARYGVPFEDVIPSLVEKLNT